MTTQTQTPVEASFVDLVNAPAANLPAVANTNGQQVHAPSGSAPMPRPAQPAQLVYPTSIAKAIVAITKECGPIKKDGENTFQHYKYQRWEDILNRMSTLLPEHGLVISQSESSRNLMDNDALLAVTYNFTIVHKDGEVWPERPVWTAFARLKDSKGTYDDKSGNKCATQAHKYFLVHLFKIRTEDTIDDSDADGRRTKRPPSAAAAPDVNPTTGEVGPYKIDTKGGTVEGFARAFIAAIQTSRALNELEEWWGLNETALDATAGKRAKAYAEINAAYDELLAKLATPQKDTAGVVAPAPVAHAPVADPAKPVGTTVKRPPSAKAAAQGDMDVRNQPWNGTRAADAPMTNEALIDAVLEEANKLQDRLTYYEWQRENIKSNRLVSLPKEQRDGLEKILRTIFDKLPERLPAEK